MFRKVLIGALITLIIASFVGCWAWTHTATELSATPTPVVLVTPTPWATDAPTPTATPAPTATPVREIVLNADGSLVSKRPALQLGFHVDGRVTEVLVSPGDLVEAGQVLARLDTVALDNAVSDAQARLEQARFNLEQTRQAVEAGTDLAAAWKRVEAARLGVVNAQGNYSSTLLSSDVSADVREAKALADFWQSELGDAWLRLKENPDSNNRRKEYDLRGAEAARAHNRMLQIEQNAENRMTAAQRTLAAAQQDYMSALSQYNAIKNGDPVRQAELQVKLGETALTQAQIDLAEAVLKAPWDAMITQVSVAPGAWAASQAVTLVDIGQLQFVTSELSEQGVGVVTVGLPAKIVLRAFPHALLDGKVAAVVPLSGVGASGAGAFTVRIDLDPSNLALRPGMTGQVRIAIENMAD